MARKIIGREKRYVEVDVRFEPDGHPAAAGHPLWAGAGVPDRQDQRRQPPRPPRWAVWGTGMSA